MKGFGEESRKRRRRRNTVDRGADINQLKQCVNEYGPVAAWMYGEEKKSI